MGAAVRSPAQNRQLWALVTRLQAASGLSRPEATQVLQDVTREVSGQEHTSRLTPEQAVKVAALLEARIGAPAPAPTPAAETRITVITPAQQRVLLALWEQAGFDTPARRRSFCERQTGKPWPQTQADVNAVWKGLEAQILRRVDPADVRARVDVLVARKGDLDNWKASFALDLQRQLGESPRNLTPHKLRKLMECEDALAQQVDA